MQARQHDSEASQSKSSIRSHSPYCEATGPIVEEGFVAAQVRAFQEAHSQAWISSRSHSPMIPCSVNQKLQKYESFYTPKSQAIFSARRRSLNLSTDSFANGVTKQISNDPPRTCRKYRLSDRFSNESNGVSRRQSQRAKGTAFSKVTLPQNFKTGQKTEKASSEDVSRLAQIDVSNPQTTTSANNHVLSESRSDGDTSPFYSIKEENQLLGVGVAEQLAKMTDSPLKTPKRPIEFSYFSGHTSQLLLGSAERLKASQERSPHSSLSSSLSSKSTIRNAAVSLQPVIDDESASVSNSPRRRKYQIRRKSKHLESSNVSHAMLAGDGGLDNDRSTKKPISLPKRIRRAWTFQYPPRSKCKNLDPVKLRSLSAGHDYKSKTLVHVSQFPSLQGNLSPRSFSEAKHVVNPSSKESNKPSSIQSETQSEQTKKRWRWWKLVLVNKEPVDQGILKKAPTISASVTGESRSEQAIDSPNSYKGIPQKHQRLQAQKRGMMHSLTEGGYEDEIKDERTLDSTDKRSGNERDMLSKVAESPPTENKSLCSALIEQGLNTPEVRFQNIQSEWIAALPFEEPLHDLDDVSEARLRSDSLSEFVGHEHRVRGNRIKSVQVIVSFDGAADLVVEARLERKFRDN